jgi:hypothetical protein
MKKRYASAATEALKRLSKLLRKKNINILIYGIDDIGLF